MIGRHHHRESSAANVAESYCGGCTQIAAPSNELKPPMSMVRFDHRLPDPIFHTGSLAGQRSHPDRNLLQLVYGDTQLWMAHYFAWVRRDLAEHIVARCC